MPRFSLVVATIHRTEELSILLRSLESQLFRDFELIVVDQNSDDRLTEIIQEWSARLGASESEQRSSIPVKYLRCTPGASRARNRGIACSNGEILAFPDDDCWYHPDTLQNVDRWFRQNSSYGILSLGCRDAQGHISGNRWWESECDLKWTNIFRTSGTCCFFVSRLPDNFTLAFDELLGPGSETGFGSGEDTDFLVTLIDRGIRGRFYSALCVGHPSRNGFVDSERAERYGAGFGRVLAKHRKLYLFSAFVVFDFGRAAIHAILGRRRRACEFYFHGKGMLEAYFSHHVSP
jgi:glycosyltransferase involved in cell wall biosynthesis